MIRKIMIIPATRTIITPPPTAPRPAITPKITE